MDLIRFKNPLYQKYVDKEITENQKIALIVGLAEKHINGKNQSDEDISMMLEIALNEDDWNLYDSLIEPYVKEDKELNKMLDEIKEMEKKQSNSRNKRKRISKK